MNTQPATTDQAQSAPVRTGGRCDQGVIEAVIALLSETFPKCFFVYERRRKPLKVKIHLDILDALAGAITPRELSAALRIYVSNREYRAKIVAGATRIDLTGASAGIVTVAECAQAKPKPKPTPAPAPARPPEEISIQAPKRRLGLADLREAGRRRAGSVSR